MTSVLSWTLLGAAAGAALVPVTNRITKVHLVTALVLPVSLTLTAVAWGALAWRRGDWPNVLVYSAFAALAVPLAIVDTLERRLPGPLMRTLYAAMITLSAAVALPHGDGYSLLRAATGMAASLLVYLAIAMAAPGNLGAGDVRLAGVIGWVLAWHGWTTLITGAVLGTMAGGVVATILIVSRRVPSYGHLPAGPTMMFGALAALMVAP